MSDTPLVFHPDLDNPSDLIAEKDGIFYTIDIDRFDTEEGDE